MASSNKLAIPTLDQKFVDENKNPIGELPTRIDPLIQCRFIQWKNVETAFRDIDYLVDYYWNKVELHHLFDDQSLQVVFSSQPYTVILKKTPLVDIRILPNLEPETTPILKPKKKTGFRSWIKKTFIDKDSTAAKSNTDSTTTTTAGTSISSISNKAQEHTSTNSSLSSVHGLGIQQQTLFNCHRILDSANQCLRNPAPHLFLVLPANLENWDDMDSTTHKFRLYFMCDSRSSLSSDIQPQHIHLSGHQGYDLVRSTEFFQLHGQYALTLLELVKHGLPTGACRLPSLDSLDILHCCLGESIYHQLTKNNIKLLVDQSIAYIHTLSLWPRSKSILGPGETRQIREFMLAEEDDNSLGDLYRTVYKVYGNPVRWLCSAHSLEYHKTRSLEKYVSTLQGTLSQQLATISVPLMSTSQAACLAKELKDSYRLFDITLRLTWGASMTEVQDILRVFAQSGVVTVHIDGINPDKCLRLFHPLDSNFGDLQLVILLNYPIPLERHVFLRNTDGFVHGLHLSGMGDYDWQDALAVLDRCRVLIAEWKEHPVNIETILQMISDKLSPLRAFGLRGIAFLDHQTKETQGWFKIQDGVALGLREATLPNNAFPDPLLEEGTICRLKTRTPHSASLRELHYLSGLNPALQNLEFPVQDGPVFRGLGPILRMRPKGSTDLQVDLFDTQENDELRVARLTIKAMDSQESGYPTVTDILEWRCKHVTSIEGDGAAAILDMASLRFPSVMVSLSLDITALTERGLASVQSIFQRSFLENLRIHCTSVGPLLGRNLGPVLRAIPWLSITSFALHSGDIDSWFYLWAEQGGLSACISLSRLLNLDLFCIGETPPLLSHATILSIHRLIYYSPLLGLSLENMHLLQEQDWSLIIGAVNFSRVLHLSLTNSNISNMKPWIIQLQDQLPELDMVYITSMPGEKHLTFVSYSGSAPASSTICGNSSLKSFYSMTIEGVNALNLETGQFPGFLDCFVESAVPNSPSSRGILKAGALYQAIVLSEPARSLSRPYRVYPVLKSTPGMLGVNLPTQESDIPSRICQLRQYWSGKSGQLHVELVPKVTKTSKTVVVIGNQHSKGGASVSAIPNVDNVRLESNFIVIKWDVVSITTPLSDGDVAVMDMASSQRPLVLKHFTLDITLLTDHGLASLRNVLQRSRLESVHINCGHIEPEVRGSLCAILNSMNESSLKLLVLQGNNVDGWLRLWGTIEEFPGWQLEQFEMLGKDRWQALDSSNWPLVQHLIQLEDPPQIHISGFVCTEWKDWQNFKAAAGSRKKLRLRVPWTAATTISHQLRGFL